MMNLKEISHMELTIISIKTSLLDFLLKEETSIQYHLFIKITPRKILKKMIQNIKA